MTRLVAGCATALIRDFHVVMSVVDVADPGERMVTMVGERKAMRAAPPRNADEGIGWIEPFVSGGLPGLPAAQRGCVPGLVEPAIFDLALVPLRGVGGQLLLFSANALVSFLEVAFTAALAILRGAGLRERRGADDAHAGGAGGNGGQRGPGRVLAADDVGVCGGPWQQGGHGPPGLWHEE